MQDDDGMNVRGLIFDYGGTLDTGGRHWGQVLWQAYRQQQVPVSEQLFREAYVHAERTLGRQPVIQPGFTFYQTLQAKVDLQFQYLRAAGCRVGQSTPVVDAAYDVARRCTAESREVLQVLHTRYPMVLVTNFYGNMHTVLQEFGLSAFFKEVIESAVVGIRKPDPEIFALGVKALGLPASEVAVIGDSIDNDIIPAQAIGCQTVWFKGQGWQGSTPDCPSAACIIERLSDLFYYTDRH